MIHPAKHLRHGAQPFRARIEAAAIVAIAVVAAGIVTRAAAEPRVGAPASGIVLAQVSDSFRRRTPRPRPDPAALSESPAPASATTGTEELLR